LFPFRTRPRRSLFLREARREKRSLVIPNKRRVTPHRAKTGPARRGAAANGAMRRCGTWQGNDHYLRPAPCLAPFGAATRLATKREQTPGGASLFKPFSGTDAGAELPGLGASGCDRSQFPILVQMQAHEVLGQEQPAPIRR